MLKFTLARPFCEFKEVRRLDEDGTMPAEQQFNKIAIVLNDARKQISAVSKALLKPAF